MDGWLVIILRCTNNRKTAAASTVVSDPQILRNILPNPIHLSPAWHHQSHHEHKDSPNSTKWQWCPFRKQQQRLKPDVSNVKSVRRLIKTSRVEWGEWKNITNRGETERVSASLICSECRRLSCDELKMRVKTTQLPGSRAEENEIWYPFYLT